jgi:hypothetical protein
MGIVNSKNSKCYSSRKFQKNRRVFVNTMRENKGTREKEAIRMKEK